MFATCIFLAAAVAALLVAEFRGSRRGVWIAKPLASTAFLVLAWQAGAGVDRAGWVLLLALALSWLGDILLIPRSATAFLLGLAAFLAGHLAFAAAFVLHGVSQAATVGAAGVVAALAVGVGMWLLPHVSRRMRGPVVAYMTAISAMVSLAAGASARSAEPVLLGAAVCFFVSDLAVARQRFVAPGFTNKAWGLPLYYFAQALFAIHLA